MVRRTPEDDQPTVEVVIGAEHRQPQCPTACEWCRAAGLDADRVPSRSSKAGMAYYSVRAALASLQGLVARYRGVPTSAGQTRRSATDGYRGFGIRHDSDAPCQCYQPNTNTPNDQRVPVGTSEC